MKIVGIIYGNNVHNKPVKKTVPANCLLGQALYCPICREEMIGWGEGCSVIYLYCKKCNIALTIANPNILTIADLVELKEKLIQIFDEISSKW
ncbi:MAG: hypothetical protein DRJ52_10370 [Thermoprotei archaeon]|nr:MAG: hypothetical protein DRJ52_10370 [Thermoprotei archaeon]